MGVAYNTHMHIHIWQGNKWEHRLVCILLLLWRLMSYRSRGLYKFLNCVYSSYFCTYWCWPPCAKRCCPKNQHPIAIHLPVCLIEILLFSLSWLLKLGFDVTEDGKPVKFSKPWGNCIMKKKSISKWIKSPIT